MTNYCICCGKMIPEVETICSQCYTEINHDGGNAIDDENDYYEQSALEELRMEEERLNHG